MKSIHHWFLGENLSTFPSVAALDKGVGSPVVVVSFWVTHGVDTNISSSEVSKSTSSCEAKPFLPVEWSTSPVHAHSWRHSENRSNPEQYTQHLNREATISSFSLEEILLAQKMLLWCLNNFISSMVLFAILLPIVWERWLNSPDPIVRRIGDRHFY